jgi:hypothetical protein
VNCAVSFAWGHLAFGVVPYSFVQEGSESFMSVLKPTPVLPEQTTDCSLQISGPVLDRMPKSVVRLLGDVSYYDSYDTVYHVRACYQAVQFPTLGARLTPCGDPNANSSK